MNAIGQDAELRVGAAEEGAVGGELARADEGHGCGGGRQDQDEFIAAGCDEDAGGGVDHEQGAEHVQCEEDRKHAGEHAQDQRDTADELEGRDDGSHRLGCRNAHLGEGGLGARDREFVELLPAVGGEKEAGDDAQDGSGGGGQGGLVHGRYRFVSRGRRGSQPPRLRLRSSPSLPVI